MSILININLFMSYVLIKFRLKISLIKKKYIVIPIISIGAYLYIYTKTTLLITLLAKI